MGKLPDNDQLQDQQIVQVEGPDGLIKKFQYNAETKTLYAIESPVIIPPFHGTSHIAEDPVPNATTDSPGLMSPDDKAKLDALLQMRLGVLGFQGAGFPDDGGFMQGDIILAAGTEFISLERIGNVVRFTVDSPVPLSCNIEECAQIFWIQDETDTSSIRPPICAGKLPGANVYGEMKIYLMPENLVVDPNSSKQSLATKGNYPTLIFKRYDDSITPGLAEFDMVLERNSNLTTKVGWAMTPGATQVPECVWFMGVDDDGEQIRFELNGNSEPGLLGALLYNGHTITRQAAVVTGYTTNALSTNQYNCMAWNLLGAEPLGASFVATNVWRYDNPINSATDILTPRTLVKDAVTGLLDIGTLVQVWEFQIGEVNGERLTRSFFIKEPNLNPATLWSTSGVLRFGHSLTARQELSAPGGDTEITASEADVDDLRLFENTVWGLTNFEDPILLADDLEATNTVTYNGTYSAIGLQDEAMPRPNVQVTISLVSVANALVNETVEFLGVTGLAGRQFTILENVDNTIRIIGIGPNELTAATTAAGGLPQQVIIFSESTSGSPSGTAINNKFIATIDYDRDALVVEQLDPDEDVEPPIFLWHRSSHKNVIVRALVGMPENSRFPPIDVLLRAPIDSFDNVYMEVASRGTIASGPFAGMPFIKVNGVHHMNLPREGWLRTMTGDWRDHKWHYNYKISFGRLSGQVMLIGATGDEFKFDEDYVAGDTNTDPSSWGVSTIPDNTTIVQLEHQDYTAPCLRLEFSVNDNTGSEAVQMQFKGGILDMSEPYELESALLPEENLVRGMRPGSYTISKTFTQDGFISTGLETPESDPTDFVVYDGGPLVSVIDSQTELWNELKVMYRDNEIWVWWNGMLVPPDTTASAALATPVGVSTPYFPVTSDLEVGKVGLRMWPGAIIREFEVRDQVEQFNEFKYGQLELSDGGTGTSSGTL